MGNFQQQAEAVLGRRSKQSFQFPTLVRETGNFQQHTGNTKGNSVNLEHLKTQTLRAVIMETKRETIGKLTSHKHETSRPYHGEKSFQPLNTPELLKIFFEKAPTLGIELLHNDRTWLQAILYGVRISEATDLVRQYIREWRAGVESTPVEHKQQNVGRCRANCYMRESLVKRSNHYHGE